MPKGRQSRQLRAEMRLCIGDRPRPASLPPTISYFVHRAILPELPSEIKTALPEYTKQTTCPGHGYLLAALLVYGSVRIKSRHFPPKKEIHDELGSAHAMNFGRNPKYLEVRSDSDATSDTGHSLLQLITARIGPES